jgi:hypothetical protein
LPSLVTLQLSAFDPWTPSPDDVSMSVKVPNVIGLLAGVR